MFFTLVSSGCAFGPSAPTPVSTRPPAPTFTPAPIEQAQQIDPNAAAATKVALATSAAVAAGQVVDAPPVAEAPAADVQATQPPPVEEVPPTPTEAPRSAEAIVQIDLMNVRGGPGTNYNVVGGANQGDTFPITGKDPTGTWWEINFNGQTGWVFGELVTVANTEAVAIAANIPVAPPTPVPAPPTPVPPPTAAPVEAAPAAPPPAPAEPSFPFTLVEGVEKCEPNSGVTYFTGFVRNSKNELRNAVCVHVAFYGPRTTKCSGCDGVGNGNWGFSPFGGQPAPPGTPVEIFVVSCPSNMPLGGQNDGFGDLTPLSKKWTRTINASEQCTGITFAGDR